MKSCKNKNNKGNESIWIIHLKDIDLKPVKKKENFT